MCYTRHQRIEATVVLWLARRECHRSHCAPMEGAEEANEVMSLGVVLCQFDGRFNRLCSRIGQKRFCVFLKRCNLIQFFAQADPAFVIKVRRNVQEFFGRVLHSFHHPGVGMPRRKHRNASHKINEAVAIRVPHFHTAAMVHHKWIAAWVGRRNHLFITVNKCLSLWARQIHFVHTNSLLVLESDNLMFKLQQASAPWDYSLCGLRFNKASSGLNEARPTKPETDSDIKSVPYSLSAVHHFVASQRVGLLIMISSAPAPTRPIGLHYLPARPL